MAAPAVTALPLAQLRPGHEASPAVNIRASDPAAADVAALAANIKDRIAAGDRPLIEPLVVVEGPKPRGAPRLYYVCNGGRRLAALTRLCGQGIITESLEVPVVFEDKAAGLEASTTAAVLATPHHPVEQFEAFVRIAEARASRPEGETIDFIAHRFGLTHRRVRQVLALGNLAPAVRQAWRQGKITREAAEAFALAADHARQETVLADLSRGYGGIYPSSVRSALTSDRVRAGSTAVAFVGLEAYREAGGTLTGDLFTDERYIDDIALLQRLTEEKRQQIAADYRAEGWGYVFWSGTPEAEGYWTWPHQPRDAVWAVEAATQRDRLRNEIAAIDASRRAREEAPVDEDEDIGDEILGETDDGPLSAQDGEHEPGWKQELETLAEQRWRLQHQLEALRREAELAAWPREEREDLAVILSFNGGLVAHPGRVPPGLAGEDASRGAEDGDPAGDADACVPPPPPPETADLPRHALQSLSRVANKAAAATIASDLDLAFTLLAASWIARSHRHTRDSSAAINKAPLTIGDRGLGDGPATRLVEELKQPFSTATLPALAGAIANIPRGKRFELIAALAAASLDLSHETIEGRHTDAQMKHVSDVAAAFTRHFLPAAAFETNARLILADEADNIFADWPKAALVAAVKEMDGEEAATSASKAKKASLVTLVAERARATGWLPPGLRGHHPEAEDDEREAA
jgi:ParB family chromosome partitioning protein